MKGTGHTNSLKLTPPRRVYHNGLILIESAIYCKHLVKRITKKWSHNLEIFITPSKSLTA